MALITVTKSAIAEALNDLIISENGLVVPPGQDTVEYFWYGVEEREASRTYKGYRVVRLMELRFLPQETRNDAGLIAKTKAAITGLYNAQARFDLIQIVAGIFNPPIGIVQCYGVASAEPAKEEAVEQSSLGLAALRATLANFVQSEFEPLSIEKATWLLSAMGTMKHSLVTIGHPDPRQNPRGGGRESPDEQKDLSGQGAYTLQQNELFFRGMSKLEEEFIWMLIAHRVNQPAIERMLAGIAAEASTWASRMSGVKGISFGISVPILLSGSYGKSGGSSYGETDTGSVGQQVSDTHGKTHTEGVTDTTSHEVSHGTSHQTGTAHTSGVITAISHGQSAEQSKAHTAGTNEGWSTADTHGVTNTDSSSTSHMPSITSTSVTEGKTDVPNVVTASRSEAATKGGGVTVTGSTQHGTSTTDYGASPALNAHGRVPDPNDLVGSGRAGSVTFPGPTRSQGGQSGVATSVQGGASVGVPGVAGVQGGGSVTASEAQSVGASQQQPGVTIQVGKVTQQNEGQSTAVAVAAWGHVRDGVEAGLCGSPVGALLIALTAAGRQALAIHRSKNIDVMDWVNRLRQYKAALDPKATQDHMSLEGIILRLEPFTQGEMALMYGKGKGSIAIEDLGLLGPEDDQWGVAILEGGAVLDEYSKSVLLGLIAWHLYNDAIVRRREAIGGHLATMNIFFEEANKILSGVAPSGATSDDAGGAAAQVSQQFQSMFRDGRKYKVLCHIMLQTVSEIAAGIFSSCANIFVGQTKAARDRDMVLAHLAKSEKGFTDEEYKRFVSRLPIAMFICKIGYADDITVMESMVVKPLRVIAREPADAEIADWYRNLDMRNYVLNGVVA